MRFLFLIFMLLNIHMVSAGLNDGLIAHYPFDGNVNDQSGNNHDGTATGDIAYTEDGYDEKALHVLSQVSVADDADLNPSIITLSAWIYNISRADHQYIINKGYFRGAVNNPERQYGMRINTYGDVFEGWVSVGGEYVNVFSAESLPLNKWIHVAVTYDGVYLKAYVNGILEDSTYAVGAILSRTEPLRIGDCEQDNPDKLYMFRGFLDEVRVYNRALEDSEIKQLSSLSPDFGLIAYYSFSGDAMDVSGNGNHGSVYGPALTTDRKDNPDSAYYFGGGGQHIEVARSASLEPDNVTVCAWVKPSDMNNWQIVLSKRYSTASSPYNSYILDSTWASPPLSWRFCTTSAGVQECIDGPTIETIDWTFLAATDDGVRRKLYVNGLLVSDQVSGGPIQYSSMGLYIGSVPDFGEGFKGKIDDIRVYNRALSANEVWQLYSGGDELEDIQTKQPDDTTSLETEGNTASDGTFQCSGAGGSPIAVKSGDYRTRMDDAVLPCRGVPLQITRFFNSVDNYDGPFSFGWCFNQTVQLMESLNTNGQETAVVRWANGVRKDFVFTNDVYDAPLGCFDVLTTNAAGFVLEMKSGMKLFFNPGGFLTNQTDRYGNAVKYEHDLRNRISQVESADGRTLNYSYDEEINRVTNITDWSGRSWSYSYSTNDDLVGVTYPDGATISYTFDDDHHLTGIYDALGYQVSSLTYAEDSGRAMSYSEGAAVDYTFEYSSTSNYTKKTDSLGRDHGFTYNEFGNKINKMDPAGNEMLFTWTGDQQINSKTDHRGYPQFFEYDDRGNVIMVSNALGSVTRYTYETNFNQVTSITDPLGNVVTNTYDQYGNLLESIDARDFTVQYQYDQYGQLTNVIDAEGHASAMSYNEHGELLSVCDPLDNTMTYAYNSRGDRVSMTDPRGNTWTYGYDVMGRLVASTNPLGQVVSYEYDANGNRTAVTDARTNTTQFTYDEYNRLIIVTNALGEATGRMDYDIYGNVVAAYDALGNVVTNSYDILNRLVLTRDPLGNPISYGYDENGNRVAVTDALANATSYGFDPLNRMSAMTNALGDVWQYQYDANHNLLAVMDANSHASTNAYDPRNMVTNSANALGHAYRYQYDGNGNVTRRADPNGAVLLYSYDAANRLTNIAYPDGSALTFTHDANGNVLSMSNRSETVWYAYDVLNRVTNICVVGLNKTIAYEYDANGNRNAMTDPSGGRTEYDYDALNRLIELRDPATNTWTFSYDAITRMTNMVMANGIIATYQYDNASRLTNLVYHNSSSAVLQSFAYTYDAVGNPLRVRREDNLYELYEYDDTYQLTRVDYDAADTVGPGSTWTEYEYDPVGNRTNLQNESVTETYIYDAANRMLSVSSTLSSAVFQWDDNGNLTNKLVDGSQSEAYAWDYDNKMISIRYADGTTNTFEYYPGGLRRSKTLAGNMAINGRFESPSIARSNTTETAPSGWNWFSSSWQDAGITRKVKNSAQQALYFTSRGSNSAFQGTYQVWSVDTGKTYRFAVQALNSANNPLSGNAYGQVSIEWKNASGAEIGRTWGPTWNETLSTDTWTSFTVTGVPPAEAVSASFVINEFDGDPAGSGTFYVDDAVITTLGDDTERTEQYVYDGQNLLQEFDGLGTLMAQYVYSLGIDSLLARSTGGSQQYYLRDIIGSVTAIADTDENLLATYRYDVFGSVRRSNGGSDNPYLFTSRRLDQDSGLYYYRARYSCPMIGAFMSYDPMGQGAGYAYVGNNPVGRNDPLGLYWVNSDESQIRRLTRIEAGVISGMNFFPMLGGPLSSAMERSIKDESDLLGMAGEGSLALAKGEIVKLLFGPVAPLVKLGMSATSAMNTQIRLEQEMKYDNIIFRSYTALYGDDDVVATDGGVASAICYSEENAERIAALSRALTIRLLENELQLSETYNGAYGTQYDAAIPVPAVPTTVLPMTESDFFENLKRSME